VLPSLRVVGRNQYSDSSIPAGNSHLRLTRPTHTTNAYNTPSLSASRNPSLGLIQCCYFPTTRKHRRPPRHHHRLPPGLADICQFFLNQAADTSTWHALLRAVAHDHLSQTTDKRVVAGKFLCH